MAVVIGTRPEAVKLAPVVQALQASRKLRPLIVGTSQHGDLVRPILKSFGLRLDHDLGVMRPGQTLWDLSARLLTKLGRFWEAHPVGAVLVQGDTATALMGGLSAFYHGIPVAHVEAGLRTGVPHLPFPEEMHRTMLASIASWHFAPTAEAVRRLRQQGIAASRIHRTGNTVVDALRWMSAQSATTPCASLPDDELTGRRLLLVTCHRRENWGRPMRQVAQALQRLTHEFPDLIALFPLHPNPRVRQTLEPALRHCPNVKLLPPLGYPDFLSCLRQAYLVWSDSGGVQEEATALGKPVLVLRETTERPEGIAGGPLRLVGTNPEIILAESRLLLRDARAYRRQARVSRVFGDGQAARRIVRILEEHRG